ncbi:hypothetical protein Tco_1318742 [Tanacetum coccineum]
MRMNRIEEDETSCHNHHHHARYRGARNTFRPQTPIAASTQTFENNSFAAGSPTFPLPPTSPAYDQAPLGHRATNDRNKNYTSPREVMPSLEEICRESLAFYSAAARASREWHRQGAEDYAFSTNDVYSKDDASQNSIGGLRRHVQPARACSYTVYECNHLNFKGTEGIVGLSQWLKKMESVFHISGYAIDNQVKFATYTLLGATLTWWNGHVRTLGHDA